MGRRVRSFLCLINRGSQKEPLLGRGTYSWTETATFHQTFSLFESRRKYEGRIFSASQPQHYGPRPRSMKDPAADTVVKSPRGLRESEWLGANILTKHSHSLRSGHQPLDQSIKCVPNAKGAEPTIRAVAEICRDLWGSHYHASQPRPPCFTIPNADLTTHLPQSDSTMQIFLSHQADLFSTSIGPPGLLL
ncbi:unnamed protein product [Prunus armeniaca]